MKLPSDKKLISIAVGISAIIAVISVQYGIELQSLSPHTFSRTADWRHIHGLGIDPIDRTILYIATHGDFYHSHDGNPPFKVDIVRADYMAFNAPTTAGIPLYASGHPASGGNTGLIKSIDGGQSWESVSKVLEPPVDFHAMSVSKSDPNTIIGFDSAGRGLFKTVDAGKSWENLSDPSLTITSIAVDTQNKIIYVAGYSPDGYQEIYRSKDDTKSWDIIGTNKGL